ncbi:uncharacterized protein LOC136074635 [Hydra vulgaris]|uniref:Uncharacterized protein LOC136074635 n=1 Tax=Hydra vulgaris TaxID=6087 RepID=A0ABM4B2Q1_HYDVU
MYTFGAPVSSSKINDSSIKLDSKSAFKQSFEADLNTWECPACLSKNNGSRDVCRERQSPKQKAPVVRLDPEQFSKPINFKPDNLVNKNDQSFEVKSNVSSSPFDFSTPSIIDSKNKAHVDQLFVPPPCFFPKKTDIKENEKHSAKIESWMPKGVNTDFTFTFGVSSSPSLSAASSIDDLRIVPDSEQVQSVFGDKPFAFKFDASKELCTITSNNLAPSISSPNKSVTQTIDKDKPAVAHEQGKEMFVEAIAHVSKLDRLITGEENDEVMYSNRLKLYRYDLTTKRWKERGIGELKITRDKTNNNCRIVMRREQVRKLCANHAIVADMELKPQGKSNKAWVWSTQADISDGEAKSGQFCANFKTSESATDFKLCFDKCKVVVSRKSTSNNQQNVDAKIQISDRISAQCCVACQSPNPNASSNPSSSIDTSNQKPGVASKNNLFTFGVSSSSATSSSFVASSNNQQNIDAKVKNLKSNKESNCSCSACLVSNQISAQCCVACQSPNANASSNRSSPKTNMYTLGAPVSSSKINDSSIKLDSKSAFKQSFEADLNTWECPACLSKNNGSRDVCRERQSPKQKAPVVHNLVNKNDQSFEVKSNVSSSPFDFSTPSIIDSKNKAHVDQLFVPPPCFFPKKTDIKENEKHSLKIESWMPKGVNTDFTFTFGVSSSPSLSAASSIDDLRIVPDSEQVQSVFGDKPFAFKFDASKELCTITSNNLAPSISSPNKSVTQTIDKDKPAVAHEQEKEMFVEAIAHVSKLDRLITGTGGIGELKITSDKTNNNCRIVMRREQVRKLCDNHAIVADMELKPQGKSNKAWVWSTQADISDGKLSQDSFALILRLPNRLLILSYVLTNGNCSARLVSDRISAQCCVACQSPNPNASSNPSSSIDTSNQEPEVASRIILSLSVFLQVPRNKLKFCCFLNNNQQNIDAKVKNLKSNKESNCSCSACLVSNQISAQCCVACQSPNANASSNRFYQNLYEKEMFVEAIAHVSKLDRLITGEENDEVMYSNRLKLYRYDLTTKRWKERGIGELKITRDKTNNNCRIVMRREQVRKLCANHAIVADMELKPQDFRIGCSPKLCFDKCKVVVSRKSTSNNQQNVDAKIQKLKSNKESNCSCSARLVSDRISAQCCVACQSPNPNASSNPSSSIDTSNQKPGVASKNNLFTFGVLQVPQQVQVLLLLLIINKILMRNFEADLNTWECPACLSKNNGSRDVCRERQSPKQKAPVVRLDPEQFSKPINFKPDNLVNKNDQSFEVKSNVSSSPFDFSTPSIIDSKNKAHVDQLFVPPPCFFPKKTDIKENEKHSAKIQSWMPKGVNTDFTFTFGVSSSPSLSAASSIDDLRIVPDSEQVQSVFGDKPFAFKFDASKELCTITSNNLAPSISSPNKSVTQTIDKISCSCTRAGKGNRGIGELKITRDKTNNNCRIVMRREQVCKLCANHAIVADMELKPQGKSNKAWVWSTQADISDGEAKSGQKAIAVVQPRLVSDRISAQCCVACQSPNPNASSNPSSSIDTSNQKPGVASKNNLFTFGVSSSSATSSSFVASSNNQQNIDAKVKNLKSNKESNCSCSACLVSNQISAQCCVACQSPMLMRAVIGLHQKLYVYFCASNVSSSPFDFSTPSIIDSKNKAHVDQVLVPPPCFFPKKTDIKENEKHSAKIESWMPKGVNTDFTFTFGVSFSSSLSAASSVDDLMIVPDSEQVQSVFGDKPFAFKFDASMELCTITSNNLAPSISSPNKSVTQTIDKDKPAVAHEQEKEMFVEAIAHVSKLDRLITGEENDEVMYSNRLKLYRYDLTTKRWKERGIGELKITRDKTNNNCRIVMRREQVRKLCANHAIVADMELKPQGKSNKAWVWSTQADISDGEAKSGQFCANFKTSESATDFKLCFDKCKVVVSCKSTSNNQQNVDAKIQKLKSNKESNCSCSARLVSDRISAQCCVACQSPNPNASSNPSSSIDTSNQKPGVASKNNLFTFGVSSSSATSSSFVFSNPSAQCCVACQSPNANASSNRSSPKTNMYTFGAPVSSSKINDSSIKLDSKSAFKQSFEADLNTWECPACLSKNNGSRDVCRERQSPKQKAPVVRLDPEQFSKPINFKPDNLVNKNDQSFEVKSNVSSSPFDFSTPSIIDSKNKAHVDQLFVPPPCFFPKKTDIKENEKHSAKIESWMPKGVNTDFTFTFGVSSSPSLSAASSIDDLRIVPDSEQVQSVFGDKPFAFKFDASKELCTITSNNLAPSISSPNKSVTQTIDKDKPAVAHEQEKEMFVEAIAHVSKLDRLITGEENDEVISKTRSCFEEQSFYFRCFFKFRNKFGFVASSNNQQNIDAKVKNLKSNKESNCSCSACLVSNQISAQCCVACQSPNANASSNRSSPKTNMYTFGAPVSSSKINDSSIKLDSKSAFKQSFEADLNTWECPACLSKNNGSRDVCRERQSPKQKAPVVRLDPEQFSKPINFKPDNLVNKNDQSFEVKSNVSSSPFDFSTPSIIDSKNKAHVDQLFVPPPCFFPKKTDIKENEKHSAKIESWMPKGVNTDFTFTFGVSFSSSLSAASSVDDLMIVPDSEQVQSVFGDKPFAFKFDASMELCTITSNNLAPSISSPNKSVTQTIDKDKPAVAHEQEKEMFVEAIAHVSKLDRLITGEENDEVMYSNRLKLYRYDLTTKRWKERGIGELKITRDKTNNNCRIVMRREQVRKLCANHAIVADMELKPQGKSNKAWVWSTQADISDGEAKSGQFCANFKTSESATDFKLCFDKCKVVVSRKSTSNNQQNVDAKIQKLKSNKESNCSCSARLVSDRISAQCCVACQSPNPNASSNPSSSIDTSNQKPGVASKNNLFTFGVSSSSATSSSFVASSNNQQNIDAKVKNLKSNKESNCSCSACLVSNQISAQCCVACQSPNANASSNRSSPKTNMYTFGAPVSSSKINDSSIKLDSKSAFKQSFEADLNTWECPACLSKNNGSRDVCRERQSPKQKAPVVRLDPEQFSKPINFKPDNLVNKNDQSFEVKSNVSSSPFDFSTPSIIDSKNKAHVDQLFVPPPCFFPKKTDIKENEKHSAKIESWMPKGVNTDFTFTFGVSSSPSLSAASSIDDLRIVPDSEQVQSVFGDKPFAFKFDASKELCTITSNNLAPSISSPNKSVTQTIDKDKPAVAHEQEKEMFVEAIAHVSKLDRLITGEENDEVMYSNRLKLYRYDLTTKRWKERGIGELKITRDKTNNNCRIVMRREQVRKLCANHAIVADMELKPQGKSNKAWVWSTQADISDGEAKSGQFCANFKTSESATDFKLCFDKCKVVVSRKSTSNNQQNVDAKIQKLKSNKESNCSCSARLVSDRISAQCCVACQSPNPNASSNPSSSIDTSNQKPGVASKNNLFTFGVSSSSATSSSFVASSNNQQNIDAKVKNLKSNKESNCSCSACLVSNQISAQCCVACQSPNANASSNRSSPKTNMYTFGAPVSSSKINDSSIKLDSKSAFKQSFEADLNTWECPACLSKNNGSRDVCRERQSPKQKAPVVRLDPEQFSKPINFKPDNLVNKNDQSFEVKSNVSSSPFDFSTPSIIDSKNKAHVDQLFVPPPCFFPKKTDIKENEKHSAKIESWMPKGVNTDFTFTFGVSSSPSLSAASSIDDLRIVPDSEQVQSVFGDKPFAFKFDASKELCTITSNNLAPSISSPNKSVTQTIDKDKPAVAHEQEKEMFVEAIAHVSKLDRLITGEENDEVMYSNRLKLYRYDLTTKRWKERGIGELKITRDKTNNNCRIVMRREQVRKLCANHAIVADMELKPQGKSNKAWVWSTQADISDGEAKSGQFCANFKTSESATDFKLCFDKCKVVVSRKSTSNNQQNVDAKIQKLKSNKESNCSCSARLVSDRISAQCCVACQSPNPNASSNPSSSIDTSNQKPGVASKNNLFTFGVSSSSATSSSFVASSNNQQNIDAKVKNLKSNKESNCSCSACLVSNQISAQCCVACQSPNANASSNRSSPKTNMYTFGAPVSSSKINDSSIKLDSKSAFKQSFEADLNTWECPACLSKNNGSRDVCRERQSPKQKAPVVRLDPEQFSKPINFKPDNLVNKNDQSFEVKSNVSSSPFDFSTPSIIDSKNKAHVDQLFVPPPCFFPKKTDIKENEKHSAKIESWMPKGVNTDFTFTFGVSSSPSLSAASSIDDLRIVPDSEQVQSVFGDKPFAFKFDASKELCTITSNNLAPSISSPNKSVTQTIDKDKPAVAHEQEKEMFVEAIAHVSKLDRLITGEENDEVMYSNRLKLYRYDLTTKRWKERGIGELKITRDKTNNNCRIVMRREQVRKLCANHAIVADMELKPQGKSNKAWVWSTQADISDGEAKSGQFCANFKTSESATDFKLCFDKCKVVVSRKSTSNNQQNVDAKIQKLKSNKESNCSCSARLVSDRISAQCCVACQSPNPNASSNPSSSIDTSNQKPGVASKNNLFTFGVSSSSATSSSFVASSNNQQNIDAKVKNLKSNKESNCSCSACLVSNQISAQCCVACQSPNANASSNRSSPKTNMYTFGAPVSSSKINDSSIKLDSKSAFKQSFEADLNTWECPACLSKNNGSRDVCRERQSPKQKAPVVRLDPEQFSKPINFKPDNLVNKNDQSFEVKSNVSSSPFDFSTPSIIDSKNKAHVDQLFVPPPCFFPKKTDIKENEKHSAKIESWMPKGVNTDFTFTFGVSSFPSLSAASSIDDLRIVPDSEQVQSVFGDKPFAFKFDASMELCTITSNNLAPSISSPNKSVTQTIDKDKPAVAHEQEKEMFVEAIAHVSKLDRLITGEENDEVMYSNRLKLYRYDLTTKRWKERGIGELKITRDKTNNNCRIVMRREQVRKLCANHAIVADMELKPQGKSNKAWVWSTQADISDGEAKSGQFCANFKTSESATDFKLCFDKCKVVVSRKSTSNNQQNVDAKIQKLKSNKESNCSCSARLVSDRISAQCCVACQSPNPNASSNPSSSIDTSNQKPGVASKNNLFTFGVSSSSATSSSFVASSNNQQNIDAKVKNLKSNKESNCSCSACLVSNQISAQCCVACQSPNANASSNRSSPKTNMYTFGAPVSSSKINDSSIKLDSKSAFKQSFEADLNTWECPACLSKNNGSRDVCRERQSPKQKAPVVRLDPEQFSKPINFKPDNLVNKNDQSFEVKSNVSSSPFDFSTPSIIDSKNKAHVDQLFVPPPCFFPKKTDIKENEKHSAKIESWMPKGVNTDFTFTFGVSSSSSLSAASSVDDLMIVPDSEQVQSVFGDKPFAFKFDASMELCTITSNNLASSILSLNKTLDVGITE